MTNLILLALTDKTFPPAIAPKNFSQRLGDDVVAVDQGLNQPVTLICAAESMRFATEITVTVSAHNPLNVAGMNNFKRCASIQ